MTSNINTEESWHELPDGLKVYVKKWKVNSIRVCHVGDVVLLLGSVFRIPFGD